MSVRRLRRDDYSAETGWYYLSLDNRAPAWTSVSALYRFLITNRGPGPYARIADRRDVLPGDVIQLGDADGTFYHSLFVLDASPDEIYIAAHSYDALWRPLSSYQPRGCAICTSTQDEPPLTLPAGVCPGVIQGFSAVCRADRSAPRSARRDQSSRRRCKMS